MIAYLNQPKIKINILRQLRAHTKADELVKGKYWEGGKGCAVGCTIHSGEHCKYEPRFGIPRVLAKLEDNIFEGLPNGQAKAWPVRFMEAVKVGTDLGVVWPQFALWMLRDEFPKTTKNKDVLAAIEQTAKVYEAWIATGKPNVAAAKLVFFKKYRDGWHVHDYMQMMTLVGQRIGLSSDGSRV